MASALENMCGPHTLARRYRMGRIAMPSLVSGGLRDSTLASFASASSGPADYRRALAREILNSERQRTLGLTAVEEVHDLHTWGLSTTETALTVHLVHAGNSHDLLRTIPEEIKNRFAIGHATIQLEMPELAKACKLSPSDVV